MDTPDIVGGANNLYEWRINGSDGSGHFLVTIENDIPYFDLIHGVIHGTERGTTTGFATGCRAPTSLNRS